MIKNKHLGFMLRVLFHEKSLFFFTYLVFSLYLSSPNDVFMQVQMIV